MPLYRCRGCDHWHPTIEAMLDCGCRDAERVALLRRLAEQHARQPKPAPVATEKAA